MRARNVRRDAPSFPTSTHSCCSRSRARLLSAIKSVSFYREHVSTNHHPPPLATVLPYTLFFLSFTSTYNLFAQPPNPPKANLISTNVPRSVLWFWERCSHIFLWYPHSNHTRINIQTQPLHLCNAQIAHAAAAPCRTASLLGRRCGWRISFVNFNLGLGLLEIVEQ